MNRTIIIGKNSSVVKSIKKNISECLLISHKDIESIDFSYYEKIYFFSWCNDYDKFLNLLKSIPIYKVIFISSVAIYSNYVRKQWNNYPVYKLKVEEYILKNGGSVLRIGIFNSLSSKFMSRMIPYTSKKMLINHIKEKKIPSGSVIYNLFEIRKVKINFFLCLFFKNLHYCTSIVPNKFIFRAPLEFISKSLGSFFYGYTADVLSLFYEDVLVGYGALGSEYYSAVKRKPKVLMSPKPNIQLSSNGFINTRIGLFFNGLARYWHGAYVEHKRGSYFRKNKLFMRRKMPPLSAIRFNLEKITKNFNFFILTSDDKAVIFARAIIMASGPINNSKILAETYHINEEKITFCDHEIFKIGSISIKEAIHKKYIKRFLFIVFKSKLLVFKDCANQSLIEFRPASGGNFDNLYDNETMTIYRKLLINFSFKKLNEAFFNKFGLGIATSKIDLIVQMLNPKSVLFKTSNQKIKKTRLNKYEIDQFSLALNKKFNTFLQCRRIKTYDGQHIVGGKELLSDPGLIMDMKSMKLIILGSPTKYKLDFKHHTIIFINKIKNKYSDKL